MDLQCPIKAVINQSINQYTAPHTPQGYNYTCAQAQITGLRVQPKRNQGYNKPPAAPNYTYMLPSSSCRPPPGGPPTPPGLISSAISQGTWAGLLLTLGRGSSGSGS